MIKVNKIVEYLHYCSSLESKFLIRILLNQLWIGATEWSFINEIIKLNILDKIPSLEKEVFRRVVSPNPHKLNIGIPLPSMLAKPSNSVDDIIKFSKEEPLIVDFKYDGERS